MYDFIKKLVSPKKPEPVVIAFTTIPAWADEREKNARTALEEAAKAPMQNIRNAAAQLQHIVNGLSGADQDPAIHPKLKSVAKNSLPLYIKAMNASLAKTLSDDIEAFYTDAAECLKSSLNSNRGQGRYLQAVFPEEMRSVKAGIDTIGRELNLLTAALATYRKQKGELDAVSALYHALIDMREDEEKSCEKERRISARIAGITSRIEAIGREETDLASDDERNRAVNDCRSALAEKEKTRDAITRNYAALSMTASHVFRKAEKIAAKQHNTGDVASFRQAIGILSHHTIPDTTELFTALTAACPIAHRMIEAADIPLKNREEREIFSDTDQFCTIMCRLCTALITCDEECRNAEHSLSTHALVVRVNALSREKTQLNAMLEKERQQSRDIVQWKAKTNDRIPSVTEELRKKIERIVGESVQLQADTNAPV